MRNTLAHAFALLALTACTAAPSVVRGADDDDDADAAVGDPREGDVSSGPLAFTVSSASVSFGCKLINDESLTDPAANQTQTRFNLTGTDLGISIAFGDELYVFFGDTIGYRDIWPIGEDPDSVAHMPLAAVQADPTSLCRSLEFLVTPGESIAADPAVQRDFAGGWVMAPPGGQLSEFITDPAVFAHMPGTFEVPAGAVVVNDALYVLYAGKLETQPRFKATLGYLARWDDLSTPGYQIVRPLDSLAAPLLGGAFVQTQAVVDDGFVWLFGTGDYRRSGVSLARVPVGDFESGANTEVLASPLFEDDGVGELSVLRVDDLFLAMYQRGIHTPDGFDNRVLLRASPSPQGPWSEAITLVDMGDPAFRSEHCCGTSCVGEQILHCDRAGLYGAYMVPAVNVIDEVDGARTLEVPFLVSTWAPYNVVLMSASVYLAAP